MKIKSAVTNSTQMGNRINFSTANIAEFFAFKKKKVAEEKTANFFI